MTDHSKKSVLANYSIELNKRLNDRKLYSDAEWPLAQYILAYMPEVVRMSAAELAKASYSSAGTVVRLSRKLGYSGFRELKLALVKEMESSRYLHQTVDFQTPFSSFASSQEIINAMASLYRESIDIIQSTVNSEQIRRIADKILYANRIYLFGFGDSLITCESFANRMIKLGKDVVIASGKGEEINFALLSKPDDVAVFVSYAGNYSYFTKILLQLKKNRTYVATLTAHAETPIAHLADESIILKDMEGKPDEKISTFYSQLAFGYIFNVLYSLLYAALKKREMQK